MTDHQRNGGQQTGRGERRVSLLGVADVTLALLAPSVLVVIKLYKLLTSGSLRRRLALRQPG